MNFKAIKALLNSDKLVRVDFKQERSWKTHIFEYEDESVLTITINKNFLNGEIYIFYSNHKDENSYYKDERNSNFAKWILKSMIKEAFNNFFDKVVEKHKNNG